MKVLIATSELHPFAKTGGLADMAGALGKYLAGSGQQVVVVAPLYRGIRDRHPGLERTDVTLDVPLNHRRVRGAVWRLAVHRRLSVCFIEQGEFYDRPGLYQHNRQDYPDNLERFLFFSKAVVQLARQGPWRPDVVHAHDWQTGFVPLLILHQRLRHGWRRAPATVFTIHNLAYQGQYGAWHYRITNLPWDYFSPDGVEFYGGMNCLKAGLVYADHLTTVSSSYAREITTPDFGCGLEGVLRSRSEQGCLTGILNGVDYSEWNTSQNPYLRFPYRAEDLSGKAAEKEQLQRDLGLEVRADVPLFGSVSRLVEQKGTDLIIGALDLLGDRPFQFVKLGTGDSHLEQMLLDLSARRPGRVAVTIGYDDALAHRIEAASDFYLMPSRYEPCGLNQLYGLRYGAVPVVRATGGLADSVVDIREDPDLANGIKFSEPSAPAVAKAMEKAMALYAEPALLGHYRRNGMTADFSWKETVQKYLAVYRKVLTDGDAV